MAAYVKFQSFSQALAEQKFDFSTDTLKIGLIATANAPDPATDVKLADVTEIAYTYASALGLTTTVSNASGTTSVEVDALNVTATGGDVGPFQYVIVYDDSATDKDLIAMWDLGSANTILDGNSGTFTFSSDTLFSIV